MKKRKTSSTRTLRLQDAPDLLERVVGRVRTDRDVVARHVLHARAIHARHVVVAHYGRDALLVVAVDRFLHPLAHRVRTRHELELLVRRWPLRRRCRRRRRLEVLLVDVVDVGVQLLLRRLRPYRAVPDQWPESLRDSR